MQILSWDRVHMLVSWVSGMGPSQLRKCSGCMGAEQPSMHGNPRGWVHSKE